MIAGRVALVFAAISSASAIAYAQPAGNVNLDMFRPAMDSRGYFTVDSSQTLGNKDISFGLGSLDWGHHLLNLDGMCTTGNTQCQYSVDNIITATLIGAFGIKAGPADLEFGFSVPFNIMNGSRGPAFVDPANSNNNQNYQFDGQGIGNVGLHFKTHFLKLSRPPHFGIGLVASIYLQTTSPKSKFLGENTPSYEAKLILDKEFGREGRLRMALKGGIRVRTGVTFTNDGSNETTIPPPPATNQQIITPSTEIPFGFGIAYAISNQKFDLVGEVSGARAP